MLTTWVGWSVGCGDGTGDGPGEGLSDGSGEGDSDEAHFCGTHCTMYEYLREGKGPVDGTLQQPGILSVVSVKFNELSTTQTSMTDTWLSCLHAAVNSFVQVFVITSLPIQYLALKVPVLVN